MSEGPHFQINNEQEEKELRKQSESILSSLLISLVASKAVLKQKQQKNKSHTKENKVRKRCNEFYATSHLVWPIAKL